MCQWSTSTFEHSCGCTALDMHCPVDVLPWTCTALWMYCPGHAREKGNDQADKLAGKATLTSGFLFGTYKMLRSLRRYLRVQSQGHHTIDRLEDRGVKRGSARRSSLKGRERAIVNQTNIGTVSKATLGKLLRDGVEAHMGFSERIDTTLS